MTSPTARPRAAAECGDAPDGSCSICADEGLEGRVLDVAPNEARVRLADGSVRRVSTDLMEDVRPGDRLVVHLGFAIGAIREEGT